MSITKNIFSNENNSKEDSNNSWHRRLTLALFKDLWLLYCVVRQWWRRRDPTGNPSETHWVAGFSIIYGPHIKFVGCILRYYLLRNSKYSGLVWTPSHFHLSFSHFGKRSLYLVWGIDDANNYNHKIPLYCCLEKYERNERWFVG